MAACETRVVTSLYPQQGIPKGSYGFLQDKDYIKRLKRHYTMFKGLQKAEDCATTSQRRLQVPE